MRNAEGAAASRAPEDRMGAERVAELREAWTHVGGGSDDGAEISHADCKRAFTLLGMSGTDVRGLLPNAPAVLKESFIGVPPRVSFDRFVQIAEARCSEDGPNCMLCFSQDARATYAHCVSFSGACKAQRN